MYVIQLNNGEQHYVQATSAVLSSAAPTATAITINPTDQLQSNAYLQSNQLGQIHTTTVQPHEATVVHQQQQHHQQQQQQQQPTDSFQEVLDYIQHLYTEIAKEREIRQFVCLFCAQDFNDLRSLLRHTSFSHRTKILDGTISLEQDFDALVRKKLLAKEQQNQNQQLYQCVQCQQMFNSLEIISEHLAHCQPPSATISNVVPSSNSAFQGKPSAELINTASNKSQIITEQYIPYGCAQCGRRYHTIRDLMNHMRTCQDETFYDASNHLHEKNWVEAPKNQHIVINEEATNVVLKTTGLWLMPEPPGQQLNSDALRGFWVMPSSTSDYIEEQVRLQQEKLRIELEEKQRRDEERARLQREEEENLLVQRQILEQQQKLRLQQQLEEQQKQQQQQQQMLLQQQLQRQSHSTVVQTIASVPNTVPLVKTSPSAVISQQNQTNIQTQRPHSTATNTIIVLNDEQLFSQSGTDALRCIQASDGSYHVIGNVDLNDSRQVTNTTSVIAHTPPTIEPAPSTGRKRRSRTTKTNNTYTQQNDRDLITLENVYQATQETAVPPPPTPTVTNSKVTNSKRRRNAQTIETPTMSIDQNQTVIQNVNVDAVDIPPQQYYLAYNDNGVLVPIDTTSTLVKNESQSNAVDLSQEQYIIEDLDASRKAQQQKSRSKSSGRAAAAAAAAASTLTVTTSTVTAATSTNTTSGRVIVPETNANDLSAYNIDDLSHLDKPIVSEKPTTTIPIKPLKTKPQFMDSFFSFLMNRESNKL